MSANPPFLPIFLCPIANIIIRANMEKILKAKSKCISEENDIGEIAAAVPKTKQVFMIFDPIILPIAISSWLWYAAIAEVASSGNDVPIDTTLSATKASEIPIAKAKPEAPSIRSWLPMTNAANPTAIRTADFQTG